MEHRHHVYSAGNRLCVPDGGHGWYSRYVLDWALSTPLEADFCIETVGRLLQHGRCDIFNTDQGAQFTTSRFTDPLLANGIQVSMDGCGRALDNIFVERLWRTVK